ncbi:MAG TPA: hypothetical protein VGI70_05950 [Polyangiales bacterium]
MNSICKTRSIQFALLLGALAFGGGCGGDDTTGDAADGGGSAGSGSGGGTSFTSIYNSSEFQKCSGCHAPNAPGKTDGTESSGDWSTRATAYASLKGKAAGLIGNFAGCNGVPLIGATAEDSLLVASLDETVRMNFTSSSAPDCNADAISDQTLKLGGALPDALLTQLKAWIDAGAPDM